VIELARVVENQGVFFHQREIQVHVYNFAPTAIPVESYIWARILAWLCLWSLEQDEFLSKGNEKLVRPHGVPLTRKVENSY
jgi:hypothetical protein